MSSRTGEDVPLGADLLGFVGLLLVLGGALLVSIRLAWLAWQAWAWWSGLVFIGAGVGLFLLAAVAAWVWTTGIPALRVRWYDLKYDVRQRRQQRQQRQREQQAQEAEGDD